MLHGRQFVLENADWTTYTRLLKLFAERPSVRLTYDRGVLEIMSPLHEHESDARFLGRLIIAWTEELNRPIKEGGSTTFRRRKRRRGLEPDTCFWIANESQVRGKRRIRLGIDPPPDLAIEVDVTHSSLDRMGIYASLAVPEVWRLDDGQLTFYLLQPDGKYVPGDSSALSGLQPDEILPFLNLRSQVDENEAVRRFRFWIAQQRTAGRW